jgi:hypothetical protein
MVRFVLPKEPLTRHDEDAHTSVSPVGRFGGYCLCA